MVVTLLLLCCMHNICEISLYCKVYLVLFRHQLDTPLDQKVEAMTSST
jgi:hypothetical protein